MGWTGPAMGIGVVLVVVGVIGLVGGLVVALVGPDAYDDANRGNEDEGRTTLLPLGQNDEEPDRAEDRNTIRAGGGVAMGAGAALALVGGVLFAVARGAEANRAHVKRDETA